MTEIKNGDTVVVDLDTPGSRWHKAEGVLLEAPAGNSARKVRITKSGARDPEFPVVGKEYRLVNLTKAPGFRVGTKAKYSGSLVGFGGQTVTVTEAIMSGTFDYRVKRADGQEAPVWHFELQRIEEPVKPAPKFKIGDRVVVENSPYAEHKGKALEVMHVGPSGGYGLGPVGNDPSKDHSLEGWLFYGDYHKTSLAPKPAPKFKVGDKVTVHFGAPHGNRTGKVIKVYERGSWPFEVRYDGKHSMGTGIFDAKELELIPEEKPKPKFKIGDWVKVFGRGDKYDGTVGTVQKVDTEGYDKTCYTIHKNDVGDEKKQYVSQNVLHFFEYQLQATEAPKPVTFKKGDIVKHKAGAHKYLLHREEGQTFIVTEVNESAKYPVRVRALGHKDARGYTHDELEAGEPLAQWEIELLDNTLDAPLTKVPAAAPYPNVFAKGGLVKGEIQYFWDAPKKADAKAEAVDGPAHYGGKDNPYEAIKVAEAWGFNKEAYLFNALKYLARAGKKGDKVEDLKKLVFYVEREIALEQAK